MVFRLLPQMVAQFMAGNVLLLCAACTASSAASPSATGLLEHHAPPDFALEDARRDASRLRGELAEVRIHAAKQDAEVQQLRSLVEEHTKASTIDKRDAETLKKEAEALRSERDQLKKTVTELEAQVSTMTLLRKSADEAKASEQAARSQVGELRSTISALTGDIEKLRVDLTAIRDTVASYSERTERMLAAAATPSVAGKKARATAEVVAPKISHETGTSGNKNPAGRAPVALPAPTLIEVQEGETLQSLATKYGTDMQALKQLNGLFDGTIRPGQRLRVPHGLATSSPPRRGAEGQ